MSSGSRSDAGEPPDRDPAGDVRWHQSRAGDQVVLGVAANGVRVAIAFPAGARRTDLRAALDERDRELDHFFETRAGGASP